MSIVRYLNETDDTRDQFFSGVPRRDLTEDEWDALPKYMQRSVDASSLYRKTPPPKAKIDHGAKDGDANG